MSYFTLNATGHHYPYSGPRDVLEAFHGIQYEQSSYEDFLRDMKHRLKLYTGNEAVLFYDETQTAELLAELGEVRFPDSKDEA